MPWTKRPSQPVVNFVAMDDVDPAFHRYRSWSLSIATRPPVKYAQAVLGKQDTVKVYLHRHWIWESPTWRLFASVRGMTLELILPNDFKWEDHAANHQRATDAINDFVDTWEAKERGLLSVPRA